MHDKTISKETERTGAEILADTLQELGTDYVFAHTGGAVIPVHAEITSRIKSGKKPFERVIFRQEPGAGHAAEGYAHISKKPGVVLVTSGPGSTNLATPIKDAHMDSRPAIFITGQVPSNLIGTDAFQENPTYNMTASISKHNYLVKDVKDLERILNEAFHIATTGRQGPVVVDICKDVFTKKTSAIHKLTSIPGYKVNGSLSNKAADSLLEALSRAERPIVIGGGGLISCDAPYAFAQFVHNNRLPTALTFMGSGAIPHDDAYFLGMPGMHGTFTANKALQNADFILGIGTRFDDRVAGKEFGKNARIAHVDIDSAEINKVVRADFPLSADAKLFLDYANSSDFHCDFKFGWHDFLNRLKNENLKIYDNNTEYIKPQYVIRLISQLTNKDSIIVTGVGQHQMWTLQNYNFQFARQWISSGGLGTMGFGLPAAIGAYFGDPAKRVVLIDGDGSFQMNMQELGTIAERQIPIKMFIFNNGYLGMVRQWEEMFNGGSGETCLRRNPNCADDCSISRYKCDYQNPDFLKLAAAYDIPAVRITEPKEVDFEIKKALLHDGPILVDVWIDRKENVLPMVPPGGSLDDMIVE